MKAIYRYSLVIVFFFAASIAVKAFETERVSKKDFFSKPVADELPLCSQKEKLVVGDFCISKNHDVHVVKNSSKAPNRVVASEPKK